MIFPRSSCASSFIVDLKLRWKISLVLTMTQTRQTKATDKQYNSAQQMTFSWVSFLISISDFVHSASSQWKTAGKAGENNKRSLYFSDSFVALSRATTKPSKSTCVIIIRVALFGVLCRQENFKFFEMTFFALRQRQEVDGILVEIQSDFGVSCNLCFFRLGICAIFLVGTQKLFQFW